MWNCLLNLIRYPSPPKYPNRSEILDLSKNQIVYWFPHSFREISTEKLKVRLFVRDIFHLSIFLFYSLITFPSAWTHQRPYLAEVILNLIVVILAEPEDSCSDDVALFPVRWKNTIAFPPRQRKGNPTFSKILSNKSCGGIGVTMLLGFGFNSNSPATASTQRQQYLMEENNSA